MQKQVAPTLLGNWREERAAIEAKHMEDENRRKEALLKIEKQFQWEQDHQRQNQEAEDPKAEERRKVRLQLWEQAVRETAPKPPVILPTPDSLYKSSYAPGFESEEWVPTQEQIEAYYRPITFWSDAATQRATNIYASNPVNGHKNGKFGKNAQFSTPVTDRLHA